MFLQDLSSEDYLRYVKKPLEEIIEPLYKLMAYRTFDYAGAFCYHSTQFNMCDYTMLY